ncbi:hypothetical protein GGR42_003407 [Saonia flava]|uniref:Uncharacterized protein n=1 Tax=Saonia flava TaxID=523696 RepID=A0A846R840_9FLAO|nr:hypothetical protein [Saonia flava]NJB72909.1 hypothetical protein [Saonia flava]
MNYKITYLVFFIIFAISNCAFQKTYWEDGRYFVSENEGYDYCKSLWFSLDDTAGGYGLVNCFINIGADENYILLESESESESKSEDEKSPNQYWIIKKINKSDFGLAKENVSGPFLKEEFEIKRTEMGLESILLNVELK